jgi:glycosyltransferase involved in cell wall biosynthesis
MKILQVVPSFYPAFVYGGPIFSIHYACQALARRGTEIDVATSNAGGDRKLDAPTDKPVEFERNYQVRYYDDTIIGRFSWAFTKGVLGDIRRADVVHLQDVFSIYAAWTSVLCRLARKPLLISARGTFAPWGMRGKRPWAKKAWLDLFFRPFLSDGRTAWHATSEDEREEIRTYFRGAAVYIIANGIDCAAYDRAAALDRAAYFARFFSSAAVDPRQATVLTALGRLHAKKAFDVAIATLGLLEDKVPDAVLLIAGGDDGERTVLERAIDVAGLSGRVALVGPVEGDEKVAFLKGSDIFLFPSHGENFGNVTLEALAAGAPVVASRNTPWSSLEIEGSGLWVENTPKAFARAALDLLARNRGELRAAAREHAGRFDLAEIAVKFEKVYAELMRAD